MTPVGAGESRRPRAAPSGRWGPAWGRRSVPAAVASIEPSGLNATVSTGAVARQGRADLTARPDVEDVHPVVAATGREQLPVGTDREPVPHLAGACGSRHRRAREPAAPGVEDLDRVCGCARRVRCHRACTRGRRTALTALSVPRSRGSARSTFWRAPRVAALSSSRFAVTARSALRDGSRSRRTSDSATRRPTVARRVASSARLRCTTAKVAATSATTSASGDAGEEAAEACGPGAPGRRVRGRRVRGWRRGRRVRLR